MNVKDFEYIVEIARQKSISKAAEHLYVSQPTISKFLQKIERELNTPLFHRMDKQLQLTPTGECVVEKAKSILNLNQQMLDEIENIMAHRHGDIRLGIPNSRGDFIVTSVLPKFQQLYPYVKVLLEPNATTVLMKQLEQGEQDILLVNFSKAHPSFDYNIVGEDEMVLVVPAQSPLIGLAECRPEYRFPYLKTQYWQKEPFILAGESLSSGRYTRSLFEMLDISPPVVLEIKNIAQIFSAVQSGIGNSIVPSIPQYNYERNEHYPAYLSIDGDNTIIKIAAVTKKGKYLSEAEKALIALMKESYRIL